MVPKAGCSSQPPAKPYPAPFCRHAPKVGSNSVAGTVARYGKPLSPLSFLLPCSNIATTIL